MTIAAGQAAATGGPPVLDLSEAYRLCEGIARDHYENFPVASRFLPRHARKALAVVYAFARQADDFADEGYGPGGPSREERLAALDDWERRLHRAVAETRTRSSGRELAGQVVEPAKTVPAPANGRSSTPRLTPAPAIAESSGSAGPPVLPMTASLSPPHADAIFAALSDTIRLHRIPPVLFSDLLSAFRQDVVVSSYETRSELLDYCRRSANPIGRIVLAVHGPVDEGAARWSDAICTGLQLANFWQDVGIDHAKNRIYLPAEDRLRAGVAPADLGAASGTPALRSLVLEEVRWTREFFRQGRPLLGAAPAPLRWHLRLVWHGGMRILEMIEDVQGDVLGRRPKLAKSDFIRVLFRAMTPGGGR